ncbi:MAG: hypothetical protein ETSY1_45450 [Candidatus Entotheonella factor]|uniref:Tyr recombinase domain-containing protein n=1 Tax=Entotheonella factor TaxID=1429438 RepID=W4L2Z8_ENTF1|nr:MAG: hypothetical protein ETSY1_45450 [Candidatus Entotheonella factor]
MAGEGIMASIKKTTNKDGRTVYRVRIRHKNQPTQTATFSKLADAKKWIHLTETSVLEGRHFPIAEAKRHTVAELIDRYAYEIMPRKRPSTVYSEKYRLEWWREQLGSRLLIDITPPVIIEERNKLARNHADSTVNRYLAILSHMFTIAIKEWQWLDDNPVHKVSKLKEPHHRTRFLSDEERRALLIACKQSRNPHLYTVVILALSTRARRGELLGMTWQNIDLQRGIILLEDTKNGERRL